jgi:hypothetical protein
MIELNILKEALDLLQDPSHWTRNAFARDDIGMPCQGGDPTAVCWCVSGSLIKTGKSRPVSELTLAFARLATAAEMLYNIDPVAVNDFIGYDAAIEVLKKAIDLTESDDNV